MDRRQPQQQQVKSRCRSSLNTTIDAIRQDSGGSMCTGAAALPQPPSGEPSIFDNSDLSWMMSEGPQSQLPPQSMFGNDDSSSMSDYSTMESQDGYFTSLLNQEGTVGKEVK